MHTLYFWSKRSQYVVFPQFWQNDLNIFGQSLQRFAHFQQLFWYKYDIFLLYSETEATSALLSFVLQIAVTRTRKFLAWQSTYDPVSSFFQPVRLLTTKSIFKRILFCWIFFFTAQKIKFSIKDFFRKCDQIRRKLRIWSHLLKKSLIENFIFCAVFWLRAKIIEELTLAISERKSQLCLFPSVRGKCTNMEFFLVRSQPEHRKIGNRKNSIFRHLFSDE